MNRIYAAIAFGAAALLVNGGAHATQQCRNHLVVPYSLTLESLTVDGRAVVDLSPYQKVKWSMERVFHTDYVGSKRGAVQMKAITSFADAADPLLSETYVP